MRKIIAFAAAAATVLALGLAGVPTAQGAPARSHSQSHHHDPGSYTPPPIQWGQCTSTTLQQFGRPVRLPGCADRLRAPERQDDQARGSRSLHNTPDSKYQGVMLVNPGGPGGSGGSTRSPGPFCIPNNAGDSYDWIGFDPRGVGRASPRCTATRTFFNGRRPPYQPTNAQIMNRWVLGRRTTPRRAPTRTPRFQPRQDPRHGRDMESLRKALGQQKINFYGFSYGTYLASVYMTLHPDRVRRFILDSTVDPRACATRATWTRTSRSRRPSTSTSPGWRSTTASTTSGHAARRSQAVFLATEAV